jgi:hypothetical protein
MSPLLTAGPWLHAGMCVCICIHTHTNTRGSSSPPHKVPACHTCTNTHTKNTHQGQRVSVSALLRTTSQHARLGTPRPPPQRKPPEERSSAHRSHRIKKPPRNGLPCARTHHKVEQLNLRFIPDEHMRTPGHVPCPGRYDGYAKFGVPLEACVCVLCCEGVPCAENDVEPS